LIPSNTLAQENQPDFFSPENRMNFGNKLFCEKDYLRAIYEYRAFLGKTNNDTIRFKVAFALQEMEKYDESIDNFKSLFFNSYLESPARLSFYKSHFLKNDFQRFRQLATQELYLGDKILSPIKKLYQVSYLIENSLPDSASFINVFEDDERDQMLKLFLQKKYPNYKSESTATILSAIIPGLGKIYADEIGDGITSFLLTGILGFLAYNNFENNHPTRGWIFSGLAAYFYAGNIYGSAAAVQNFNAGINFNFDADLNFYLNSKEYFIPKPDFLCK
jgi:TM2 domain-containing membrane protein YozV